jgi:ligand-binding sensor domain-containing protein
VQEPVDSPPPAPITTISQYQQIGEYVREIFQDRDGNLWFSTSDGVCRYDGRSLTYLRDPEESGWSAEEILQDEDGALWFAVVPGIRRYENGKFINYTVADGLSHRRVLSMMLDSAGTLWAGTQGGVCRFDGESFVPFPIPRAEVENPYSNLSPLLAWGMAEDQDGNLWFGMDGEGVRKFDGESFTTYTTKDGLASNNVRSVYADRRGRVWIGTNDAGVSCYDGTEFRNFTKEEGLTNNTVWTMLEDKAGNMWFSGNGATRYDGETFTAFPGDPSLTINGGPAHNGVMGMFEDRDGIFWIGCTDGLWRLDGESFINVTKRGPWPGA